jgi:hypothetical protein
VDAELAELASTAASAVVQALVTDGWQRVKSAVGRLWRRAHPEQAATVEAELAEAHIELLIAGDNYDDPAGSVSEMLVGEWRERLRLLLATDPSLADELRALVAELAPGAAPGASSRRVHMRARARDRARIYQAGRDMRVGDV